MDKEEVRLTKQQKEKWERTRAKGKRKFIVNNGVIGWGLPTAFLYTSLMTFLEHRALVFDREFYELLVISVILFPIGGIAFGMWVWGWSERAYNKATGAD